MGYCRFRNTRDDLRDCLDALREDKLLSADEDEAGRWLFEEFLDFCQENCIITGYDKDEIKALFDDQADEACDTLSEAVDGLEDIITSLEELAKG